MQNNLQYSAFFRTFACFLKHNTIVKQGKMAIISKAQIKTIRSLQMKKFRDELGLFVAEGDKCIGELIHAFEPVYLINFSAPGIDASLCYQADEQQVTQMSSLRTPQGSIGVFKIPQNRDIDSLVFNELVLCLDDIQDPGNLGTIIRTADWFGVRNIVCSTLTADCYNSKVVQATMGALSRVKIYYGEIGGWLSQQSCPIYGTLLEGQNMYEILPKQREGKAILLMGNEGNGIRQDIRPRITHPIRIPSYPEGCDTSESLNVAIATAVVLSELRRQIKN